MSRKTLYLIDGSSYFYRAFYAIRRLTNARGMATQAIYGFAQMLQKVLRERQPDIICVVFDAPGPTFRHDMYRDYKATRQRMPEDLAVQVPYIKDLVDYQGVSRIEMEGFEADDIIASLTREAAGHSLDVVIVSGDKDLHQLVHDPQVVQWDPQKDWTVTASEVKRRYGVSPQQMTDFLALMGDSSDHIPGVPGVGEKTATRLLQEWDSLENLFEHLDHVKPESLRKKLQANKGLAQLSRRLVTLRSDIPVARDLEQLSMRAPQAAKLAAMYEELGFKSLLEALRQQMGSSKSEAVEALLEAKQASERTDRVIREPEELKELVAQLMQQDRFGAAVASSSTDPLRAELLGMAFCWEAGQTHYLPFDHSAAAGKGALRVAAVVRELEPVLSRTEHRLVGHDVKQLWLLLRRNGIEARGFVFDTMVANYLLDTGRSSHSLESIAAEHLGERTILSNGSRACDSEGSEKDVHGLGKREREACAAVELANRLAPILSEKLVAAELKGLFDTLELPLIEVLARMEYRGILVDGDKLKTIAIELDKTMEQKATQIYQMAGEDFNIQSPKQLAQILFEKLGLPVIKKTKSGPSTDMAVLEALAAEHPIAENILSYRSVAKLKGTYVDALPKLIHPETGRIHTSFNQTVTATGRLSSSNPNLQNIPIRSEDGRRIRSAFIPCPGSVLLTADYSQIELRILAHYSEDEHLVAAFQAEEDIHRRTAAEMLGIHPHEVTAEMRRQAKAINFGIIYGMGPFGLARQLGISNKMAKAAIDRYFQRYRGVKNFIERTVHKDRERGYAETLFGRKRSLPELQSRNRTVRQQGERLAVNTTIQGSAADLIKKAMIDIDGEWTEQGMKTAMLLQVHDELVFEVPRAELAQAKKEVRTLMENVWPLIVPLRVDLGVGDNWATAHP